MAEARPSPRVGRRTAARSLVLALGAACCAACSDGEALQPPLQLVDLFPLAEVTQERWEIRPGEETGRASLGEGWGHAETSARGQPFAWTVGPLSSLRLALPRGAPLTLRLQVWPLAYPGAPAQHVTLTLDGKPLGGANLENRWEPQELTFPLPGDVTPGLRLLELRPALTIRPADVLAGSADDRELGLAVVAVAVVPGEHAAGPLPGRAEPALFVPGRTQIDYHFQLPGPARLVIAAVRPGGEAGRRPAGRLVVEVAGDGAIGHRWSVLPSRQSITLRLPASGAPLRLRLSVANPPGEAEIARGLVLVAPRILPVAPRSGAAPPRPTPPPRPPQRPTRPNVLVYLVDSLRADHLGCYGYAQPVSPRIDDLAASGVRFAAAVAQSSWTRPAVGSLLTGLHPSRHGAEDRRDALGTGVATLPDILGRLGYETAGFVTNGNVSEVFGFARGFATFRHLAEQDTPEHHVLSDRLNEEAFAWLAARDPDRPFFLYLHASDPHYPYAPRAPYRSRFAATARPGAGSLAQVVGLQAGRLRPEPATRPELAGLYDAEIAFNDEQLGRLLDHLAEARVLDETLVVFLADHGEELSDHGGWGHGATLYEEQLAIPLIIRLPAGEGAGRVVREPVRQVDVLPTLLDYLGEPHPAVDGRSLLPLVAGARAEPVAAVAQLALDGRRLSAIREGQWKLICAGPCSGTAATVGLFRLEPDPRELDDLAAAEVVRAGWLRARLRALGALAVDTRQPRGGARIGPELERQLTALGYL